MIKEELLSKIETFVNGILDTLSQDKNSIVERIDEELKDFIITVGYIMIKILVGILWKYE